MRTVLAVTTGLATMVLSLFATAGTASAQCLAPSLSVNPTSGPAGSTVTVHGEGFGTACNDTQAEPDLGDPAAGINLYFVNLDGGTKVATVDADAGYEFTTDVVVPTGAQVGSAGFATALRQGPPAGARFTVTDDADDDTSVALVVLVVAALAFGAMAIAHHRRRA